MSDVVDNPALGRFEVTVDGRTGELTYRLRANRLVLIHTEVPEELAGHGLAGELVKGAIARAERDGLTVVPLCPYRASGSAGTPTRSRTWTSTGPRPSSAPDAHHCRSRVARIAASKAASSSWRRAPSTISASEPTGTRSGGSGSSIASAIAWATISGPGRPPGPVTFESVPSHCSISGA